MFPGSRYVGAGHEAVRRDLLGRRDDGLGVALVRALDDEPEQMPHVAAALLRAGCLVVRLIASLERGSRFVDYPVLGAGKDC